MAFVVLRVVAMPVQAGLGRFGSIEIRQPYGGSEIVVRASARAAGAIDSLTWRGTEFINSYDHGRELQSAASFNRWGECFNPTEAGSRDDDTGRTSSSALVSAEAEGSRLTTRTRMAFWLSPGERSPGCRPGTNAINDRVLSDHELTKVVTLGAHGLANVIAHAVTYRVPAAYDVGIFEALTAHLPPTFSQGFTYEPVRDRLAPPSESQELKPLPIILATAKGDFALGIYSGGMQDPRLFAFGFTRGNFSHLQGAGNATVRSNCVFALKTVTAGDYPFTCYTIVGSLDEVKTTMRQLARIVPMIARQPSPR